MNSPRKLLSSLVAAGALLALAAPMAGAAVTLKVGTAAAPDSAWGRVFKDWKSRVETATSKNVSIDFFYNSTQGSETTMVDKMKAGQLDGAAVTSTGLGKIDKRMLMLQLPGVIRSWKAVDAVRAQMGSEFERFLGEKKIVMVQAGDVGLAHFLSKGFEVHSPDDLKGKSPWVYADEPVLKAVYSKIGGVNPFSAELMSVLPNIDNGKINCLSVSALAAEMLQWNSKFDNAVDSVNGIVVGAVVMSSDALDKLPGDQKKAVLDAGHDMGKDKGGLKALIRNEDAAAWARFKSRSGVKIYTPNADDTNKWAAVFKGARDALKAGTFDAGLVTKIESIGASNN
jgi:TRAP-type C4-dicarboxylate transport system substrate-binding protein